jgi:hypothetical protein
MVDDIALHRDTARRAQAEALLRNELLTEAWAAQEAELIQAWRMSAAMAHEEREWMWRQLQAIEKARAHLITIINDGKLAQREIDERQVAHGRL